MLNLIIAIISFCLSGIFFGSYYEISGFNLQNQIADYELYLGVFFSILTLSLLFELLSSKANTQTGIKVEAPIATKDEDDTSIVTFISMLQEKGRILDFAMDDIEKYSDEEVGRVARVVHQGIRDVFVSTTGVRPLHKGLEGEVIKINENDDFSMYKMLGTGTGNPPFSGTVVHRGWIAEKLVIPKSSLKSSTNSASKIIQAVEIEVNKAV